MKNNELNKLEFKEILTIVYEDIEPHLFAELSRLRKELILLPENTSEKDLLSIFERSVINFNKIDLDETIENGIDTEEREGLCEALYRMGTIVGLDENREYLDEWRDW